MKPSENCNDNNPKNINIHNKNIKLNPIFDHQNNKADISPNSPSTYNNNTMNQSFAYGNINVIKNNTSNQVKEPRGSSIEKKIIIKPTQYKPEKEDVEFPNIRAFQKELMHNIYAKESGEILSIIRKSNENIRSTKMIVYEPTNLVNEGFSNNTNINIPAENQNKNTGPENKNKEDNDLNSNSNYNNNNNYIQESKEFQPEMIGIRLKSKGQKFNSEVKLNSLKYKKGMNNIVSKELVDSSLFNNYEVFNKIKSTITHRSSFSNSSNFLGDSNIKVSNKTIANSNNYYYNNNNSNNTNNDNPDDKSVYLTQSQSSKNGFPKILKNNSINIQSCSNNFKANSNSQTLFVNYQNAFGNTINNSDKKPNNTHTIGSSRNEQSQQNSPNRANAYNFNNNSQVLYKHSNSNNSINNNNNIYLNSSSNNINLIHNSSSNTLNSINRAVYNSSNKYFCPHCEHCNVIKDDNLEKYFNMKEARNIVRKSLDFIVTNYQTDQSYLDFLLGNNNPGLNNYLNYMSNHNGLQQINTNNNLHLNSAEYENLKFIKHRTKFDIDILLNTFPKHTYNRTVLQLVTHFLDALINDKVSLDKIAGPDTFEKLRDSFISQGISFKEIEGEIEFDKELDLIFDESTKEKLRKLFKKKYMNMKKNEEENHTKSEEQMIQTRKRFMLLFLIFIQILSEIGSECKEKAVLLYRVFKLFFVEQEKKWTVITNHMKEKINYYKELAKTVIQQKNKHLAKIEAINDCLFANKLSMQNLQDHKKLIQDLLNVINEKRDQIYLLTSENEILTKELSFWLYDFDKLKLDNDIRNKLKELNMQKLMQNVNDEMSHKQVPENEKLLLANADRYLIVSGHRSYFYDQKNYYLSEIARISDLYDNCKFKKKSYKKQVLDIKASMEREIVRLEKDIQYFRDKLSCEKKDVLVQTDVDKIGYNKILKNNVIITHQRRMQYNKLTNFIEKIKFNCSKYKPIAKKSILNFIPEVYNEKIEYDSKLDLEGKNKSFMDEFFLRYLKDKFKMTKIINRNCEQTLISVLKYSSEDTRIDLFRKFLGIGDDRIKREVLDCFLGILKNLPISFYKLFEETESSYIMTLDNCMEIYTSKFSDFSIHIEGLEKLLRNSLVLQNEKELENLGLEAKKDIFYLRNYYTKQNASFQLLLNKYKDKSKNEEKYVTIADQIILANRDSDLNFFKTCEILKRNFKLVDDNLSLESFLNYFIDKYIFKIKITDFVRISTECFVYIFSNLEKNLLKMWELTEGKRNGIILYRDFETCMSMILGNSENKWKTSEYFKLACDSPDKDFLAKEEFISFCLNNKDILACLFSERKNLILISKNK